MNTVSDFLNGRYVKRVEIKEIMLSERIFADPNGVRKRETLWILLDYGECKWRKVKRTAKMMQQL
ncbi:hypothetical protein BC831DRAFT_443254 [Entophlyctis helioformis]|nr:hypothetical protein BC831DRAFT_443254 [Entophlyctis helioformis]